ncbi:MAG: hypothetical protein ACTHQE_00735 [Thermomicrobiales bacterium]
MYYPANRHEHAAILSDLAIYGNHAPHLRYRQERLRAAFAAGGSQGESPTSSSALRTWIGARLIAWGERLEGCTHPAAARPA